MWKLFLIWLCVSGYCSAGPLGAKRNMPIIQREEELPNAAATGNEANKPEAANIADEESAATAAAAPQNMLMISTLTLPSNATSIRADITDGFSCANKSYGYYADVENDCQIFHVCLPVTYADGKENTFRWSFICPEETIFSQESFTCMRREDMSIECEDSSQYYELNRNFGTVEEDNNKNNQVSENVGSTDQHVNTLTNEDQVPAMSEHMEHEQQQQSSQTNQQPLAVEKPMKTVPSTVTDTKEKPVKSPKPSRRKPATATISGIKKKKTEKPLRKAPSATTILPNAPTTITAIEQQADESKPTPPRFSKRPTMSINLKEKLHGTKQPELLMPIRTELYSQKRKRPVVLNKKDATTVKAEGEIVETTPKIEIVKHEITNIAQSSVEATPEFPQLTTAAAQDTIDQQASETSSVSIKPETSATNSNEKKVSIPQPTEPETPTNIVNENIAEVSAITPLEAFEEIPAVITEILENSANDQEPSKPVLDNDNDRKIVDKISSTQTQILTNEPVPIVTDQNDTPMPAIFQQNSEEISSSAVSLPLVEELEEQKPQDAPEIISATSDMDQQDPVIEQMFAETAGDANKQTMGGFKPVDPAMAAEAEALIADFINTLMKSDQSNSKPILPSGEIDIGHVTDEPATHETKIENGEIKAPEIISPIESQQSIEEQSLPSSPDSILPSIMMMNNHPGEIFQIPVQVIQTPIEELTETDKPNKPLSVDDVIELVKEQLDKKPAKEYETDDSKKTQETHAGKINEAKIQKLSEPEIMPIYNRVSAEPNENLIKAQATNSPNTKETTINSESSIPEVLSTQNAETENQTETKPSEVKIKAGRSERARSIKTVTVKMDPRKRRFLFRSDAS